MFLGFRIDCYFGTEWILRFAWMSCAVRRRRRNGRRVGAWNPEDWLSSVKDAGNFFEIPNSIIFLQVLGILDFLSISEIGIDFCVSVAVGILVIDP